MSEKEKAIAFFNVQIRAMNDSIKKMQKAIVDNLAVIKAFKYEINRLNRKK